MTGLQDIDIDFDCLIDDRYRPVEWAGSGGMGRVLKAEDTDAGNLPVAIKFFIPPQDENEQHRNVLQREMEAMVQLYAHSYIVQVKNFGWLADQTPYLVMDFMSRGSLKDRLSVGQLTPALQRRVLEEVCDALDFIHAQGIAHLDLKPSNIFFDRGWHIRIGDFGIAQALERTYPEVVTAGTPGYMAPEQKDEDRAVDHRADIYALGIVTWQMLTRKLPEPESLSSDRLHPELVKGIRRACSRDPGSRYESASAFWKSIRTWLPRRQLDGTTVSPDAQFGHLVAQVPLTYRDRVRRVMEDYTVVFGGRDRELAALDEWLSDTEYPCGLVQAPAGHGKTALLANWTREIQYWGWHVVFHPISIRYGTADVNATVRCLGNALAPLFDVDLPKLNQSPDLIRAQIVEWLHHGMPEGERLLLVVDGLDEALGDYVKSLFPNSPGPRVKLLTSARPLANTSRLGWVRQLNWDVAATEIFTLDNLNQEGLADVLRGQVSDELNALADDDEFVNELARVSEGDPLTAKVIVDALRAGEITPESLSRRPPGLDAYLEEWMQQLEEQADSEAAWRLLGLCAVALGPLTSNDLAALAPEVFTSSRHIRGAVRAVERFILGDGTPENGYVFSHPRLREYFESQLLSSERRAYQEAFVSYGQRVFDELPDKSCPSYVRQFWVRHLAEAEKWEKLHKVVATGDSEKQLWAETHYSANGSYAGYLSDLSLAWEHADEVGKTDGSAIGKQVRYALIESSIHSLAANVPVALLLALVKHRVWSPMQGLAYAQQVPDAEQRARALTKLVPHLSEELGKRAQREALEAAREVEGIDDQVQVLAGLAYHLPKELQGQALQNALEMAREIESNVDRVRVLMRLLPCLAELGYPNKALAMAREFEKSSDRAKALTEIVPRLPENLLREALAAAQEIEVGRWKAEVLAEMTSYLPEQLLREALKAAQEIEDRYRGGEALVSFVHRLAESGQFQEALAAARGIGWADDRARALAGLAPYLSDKLRKRVLQEALVAAREMEVWIGHPETLVWLVPDLTEDLQERVLEEALGSAQAIEVDWRRAKALARLAPDLRKDLQEKALREALEAAQEIEIRRRKAEVLTEITPLLPDELREKALQEALTAVIEGAQSDVLADLAPYLQEDLLREALAAAEEVDSPSQVKTLASLASYLPEELQMRALRKALAVAVENSLLLNPLAGLVPYLPEELLQEALATAQEIHDADDRAKMLAGLASYSPEDLLQETLTAARRLEQFNGQVSALIELAPHLSEALKKRVSLEILEAAGGIQCEWIQSEALAELVPYLSGNLRKRALREALDAAIESWKRGVAVKGLTPRLPEDLLQEALATAREVEEDWPRDLAFTALAPELAGLGHLQYALDIAQEIEDEHQRDKALVNMVRQLAELGHQWKALEIAQEIDSEFHWDEALSNLIRHLTGLGHSQETLEIAQEIETDRWRTEALAELAPHLPGGLQEQALEEALEVARGMEDRYQRAEALVVLLPHLSRELQEQRVQEALTVAQEIEGDRHRAEILARLAPHLVTWMQEQPTAAITAWQETLHTFAARTRKDLLGDLRALAPFIHDLGGEKAIVETFHAIQDVGRWWP
jgi:serine/threonine protein kinase